LRMAGASGVGCSHHNAQGLTLRRPRPADFALL
jgi:hypothetical protein